MSSAYLLGTRDVLQTVIRGLAGHSCNAKEVTPWNPMFIVNHAKATKLDTLVVFSGMGEDGILLEGCVYFTIRLGVPFSLFRLTHEAMDVITDIECGALLQSNDDANAKTRHSASTLRF